MIGDESRRVPEAARKARGAGLNMAGRFERLDRVAVDDGWDLDEPAPVTRTEVAIERPRSIIARNASPDIPSTARSIPTAAASTAASTASPARRHSYLGLSPGLDFETRLTAKPEAAKVLAAELSRRGYVPDTIAMGTNTDPYQPIEKKLAIMRAILRVLQDFRHPVAILTKGALIERDADILGEMARDGDRGGRALGDDARPQARPGDGAAGRRPRAAAAGDPPALRRRHPDAGLDRPGDPRAQRPRARGPARRRARGRRRRGRLRRAAPAARSRAALQATGSRRTTRTGPSG